MEIYGYDCLLGTCRLIPFLSDNDQDLVREIRHGWVSAANTSIVMDMCKEFHFHQMTCLKKDKKLKMYFINYQSIFFCEKTF